MCKVTKTIVLTILASFMLLLTTTGYSSDISINSTSPKKILHIESYHYDYPWSKGITDAIRDELKDHKNIILRTHHMNTKINTSEEYKKQAALKAKKLIEEFKPDLIIASDDNANKHVIAPYFKNSDIPILFVGINWDASKYGFPTKNITGMLGVHAINELLNITKSFTHKENERVALLTYNTVTGRIEADHLKKLFNIKFEKEVFVSSFDEWKKKFKELQNKVDVIYMFNIYGMDGFNKQEAIDFINKESKVLTCTSNSFMKEFAAITYASMPEEQGEWAAKTALEVLNGKPISEIPITRNRKGKIYINTKVIDSIKLNIPTDIMEVSHFIH